ncbi:hypothetical protein BDZ89DRAFT_1086109 [Hymenopellis radicata]|nr:hypothetical protein BDZ89DRAFT_1086109 [Hymenopellis radicata]
MKTLQVATPSRIGLDDSTRACIFGVTLPIQVARRGSTSTKTALRQEMGSSAIDSSMARWCRARFQVGGVENPQMVLGDARPNSLLLECKTRGGGSTTAESKLARRAETPPRRQHHVKRWGVVL